MKDIFFRETICKSTIGICISNTCGISVLLFIAFGLLTCHNEGSVLFSKSLSPSEYVQYMSKVKGELQITQLQNEIELTVQYLPSAYQKARTLLHSTSDSELDMEQFEGHHYFNLRIRVKGKNGLEGYLRKMLGLPYSNTTYTTQKELSAAWNQLSFDVKDNFKLITTSNKEVVSDGGNIETQQQSCVLYHLEREHLVGQGIAYSLVFKQELTESDKVQLHYQNDWFAPQGITFDVSKQLYYQYPKLEL